LLANDEVDVNAKNETGQTPLLYAIQEGYSAIVELLLAKSGIDANAMDQYGHSPLELAIRY
ncbi:hypothetical protein M431DRAFT_46902, partial [Trichoderma harzianum CBS 226.95]